ncbi:uncharacterized protein LOC126558838 [Anopheles maculipalpis]|uniref:uncharacterized protein LOC126558838 n=1 Tax=Anopheles maculipalpis TaxID=1496333 RepID=UPI0021597ABD|nr:uncharacterized protein LOC126558838 [Anopheles maculipalpis]
MSKPKSNTKKSSKNIRSVLAQPFNSTWPRIPDNDINRCSLLLQNVERKHIIAGCNGVIKLLEKGALAAFFVLDNFNPQIFAKLIIQMARKRNPSVLVLTLPSFPNDVCRTSVMMGIKKPKDNEQSEPVQALLKWMKKVSINSGFITEKPKEGLKNKRKVPLPKAKSPNDTPMTDAEVAKLYVFEPKDTIATETQQKKRVAKEMEHFISFSDNASSIIVSKNEYQQQTNEPRKKPFTNQKLPKGETYLPLTVNRVQGNPDRVEHKKKRRNQ